MALIGKIREKSWLLIAVIGIAMLAFIIGDLGSMGGGPQEDVYGIGTVNGEKVDEQEYNLFLNNARNNIMQDKQQKILQFNQHILKRMSNLLCNKHGVLLWLRD